MINIDKKKIKGIDDFELLLDSERIAYYSYKIIFNDKTENEYVDIIANTCCVYSISLKQIIKALVRAKDILKNDYDVNMYSLPFYREIIKLSVEKYDLLNQLENYFKKNNINYDSKKILNKAHELVDNNSTIEELINKIDEIDLEIKDNGYKKIDDYYIDMISLDDNDFDEKYFDMMNFDEKNINI